MIAQRQVRQIKVAHIPIAGCSLLALHALPEKCQLKAEAVSVGGFQVAGVIPPLGFVVRMIEVIARKFVLISRQRLLILRCTESTAISRQ